MAGVSPANSGSTLAVIKPQEAENNNSPPGWFSLIFSNKGSYGPFEAPLRELIFSCLQVGGKVILAGACLIITDDAIDRFFSKPYRTVLKVILVVAAVGLCICFLVSLKKILEIFNRRIIEIKNQSKESNKTYEELEVLISEGESIAAIHDELRVALKEHVEVLEKRGRLLKEKIFLIDNRDKLAIAKDCLNQVSNLRNDIKQIIKAIESEVIDETQTEDIEELVLMLPVDIEQETKIRDARGQQLVLLQRMIACYDELFKKIGIVTEAVV